MKKTIFILFGLFFAILTLIFITIFVNAGYEDLTTYTEVDPNNRWSLTGTTKNSGVEVPNNEDSYLYKDFTAGHFTDFEFDAQILVSAYSTSGAAFLGLSIAANLDDGHNNDGIQLLRIYYGGGQYRILLRDQNTANEDYYVSVLNTLYYCTVKREGTTCTNKIYSDSGRTNLLDTLTITSQATAFRYVYAGCSLNYAGTTHATGYIKNLDLKEVPPNNVPIVNLYLPLNESVGNDLIPSLSANVTDLDGHTMNLTWYSNSSGSWVIFGSNLSINNGTYYQSNTNFSDYDTTYYWNCSVNDGTDSNNSEIFHFTTKSDSVTITRVSYSPTNIRINNTDYVDILFNITTEGTPINHTSLLFAHTVNQTLAGYGLNFTYRILKDSVELRADNRNEDKWYEQFNATGTGEIGYHGEWGVHDNTSVKFIYVDSGSNWTTVRFDSTTSLVPHLFSNICYIDRTDLQDEIKTSQIFGIYGNNIYKAKFNMTDTNFYDDPQYNNSLYQFYYNANDTGTPNKPLKVYLANSSYTSGKPITSNYCVLIDERLDNDVADYSIRNSSYWGCNFSTNATGYVGSLKMTELFYFIFETKAGDVNNKFDLAFCDSNVSNRDFNNSDFTEYSLNGGNSWSIQNGSVDCHLKYAKLDDSSRIDYKVYAQDTSDNSIWSIIYTDLIDIVNVHPNPANILTQNGTITSYNVSDIVNITYKWIGDPNQDTCYVNTTCHDSLHNIVAYIENRSITHLEVETNLTWWINWNTSNVPIGNEYYINIIITDVYGLFTISKSNGTFNLTSPVIFYFTNRYPLNNTENISISRWMYCSCNVSNNINNNMNISFYLSETGLTENYYLLNEFENVTNKLHSVYINENYPIIYDTTYYWYIYSEIYNNNIYNNQSDIYKFTTNIEGGDNIIGIVNSQWILILTSILFGFFFYVGYKSDKNSGGFLLIISGFTMLYLQTILPLSPIFIIPILSIFSLYIILIGIYKWLFAEEKKDE
jgi:hypothetical protein